MRQSLRRASSSRQTSTLRRAGIIVRRLNLKRDYFGGKSIRVWACLLAALLMVAAGCSAQATPQTTEEEPSKEAERLTRAAEVFKEIMDAPDQTIPRLGGPRSLHRGDSHHDQGRFCLRRSVW